MDTNVAPFGRGVPGIIQQAITGSIGQHSVDRPDGADKNNVESASPKAKGNAHIESLQLLHGREALRSNASTIKHFINLGADAIMDSLFNGPEPLLVSKDGKILNGNSRVHALQKLGKSLDEVLEKIGPNNIHKSDNSMFPDK